MQGEDVVSTPDLESALRDAAKEGDVDTVQTMIDNGVVDLNAGAPEVRAHGLTFFNPSHTRAYEFSLTPRVCRRACMRVRVCGRTPLLPSPFSSLSAFLNTHRMAPSRMGRLR